MDKQIEPWVEHSNIWSTKAKFMGWLRGGIRKALWNTNPVKLNFIKSNRTKIENPKKGRRNKSHVWGGICAICNNEFVLKDLQVDHIHGENTLRNISEIQKFVEDIAVNISDRTLQFVCKECHDVKSYSERYGVSVDDAKNIKKVIKYMALPVKTQKNILEKAMMPNNNAVVRRESFNEIINNLPEL
jgi:5-methylcytosine-specific restriction endonuclease McrA